MWKWRSSAAAALVLSFVPMLLVHTDEATATDAIEGARMQLEQSQLALNAVNGDADRWECWHGDLARRMEQAILCHDVPAATQQAVSDKLLAAQVKIALARLPLADARDKINAGWDKRTDAIGQLVFENWGMAEELATDAYDLAGEAYGFVDQAAIPLDDAHTLLDWVDTTITGIEAGP